MSPDPLKLDLSTLPLGPIQILVPHYAITRPETQAKKRRAILLITFPESNLAIPFGPAAEALACSFCY